MLASSDARCRDVQLILEQEGDPVPGCPPAPLTWGRSDRVASRWASTAAGPSLALGAGSGRQAPFRRAEARSERAAPPRCLSRGYSLVVPHPTGFAWLPKPSRIPGRGGRAGQRPAAGQ